MIDLILAVAREFHWSWDEILSLPVKRFWAITESIGRHNKQKAEAYSDNPSAGLQEFEDI